MNNRYTEINNSYKKRLVYHLGSEAGFFSEYNNMILAMLYCLKQKIRFELYSKDANFGILNGWTDFFEPFCSENYQKWHEKYNFRQRLFEISLLKKIKTQFYKIIFNTQYLTYELWNKFHIKEFESEYFEIPELGINGDLLSASKKIIKLTWNYNKKTKLQINSLVSTIGLPKIYNGIHIRGGDKFLEFEKLEVDSYMKKISKISNIKNIFVLTDDYRIVSELRENYSEYHFYTLCKEDEIGYFHSDFDKVSLEQKRNDMVKLFASMDILANSQLFVGTFSSNPGMYLGMRMDINKVKGVDLEKWCVW